MALESPASQYSVQNSGNFLDTEILLFLDIWPEIDLFLDYINNWCFILKEVQIWLKIKLNPKFIQCLLFRILEIIRDFF